MYHFYHNVTDSIVCDNMLHPPFFNVILPERKTLYEPLFWFNFWIKNNTKNYTQLGKHLKKNKKSSLHKKCNKLPTFLKFKAKCQ